MIVKSLNASGLRSEHCYTAGFASIAASYVAWAVSEQAESAGVDRADRWGIFVGHWAPTFFALGLALANYERD
ncbi:hypothetical protein ACIRJR_30545 [Streptomyces sp. NPDC102402]|uniref:hypothetical protein n=1 Tax=Streptomyces sp. NPDC102402 TaxID=3366169 RepID=UPI00382D28C8